MQKSNIKWGFFGTDRRILSRFGEKAVRSQTVFSVSLAQTPNLCYDK